MNVSFEDVKGMTTAIARHYVGSGRVNGYEVDDLLSEAYYIYKDIKDKYLVKSLAHFRALYRTALRRRFNRIARTEAPHRNFAQLPLDADAEESANWEEFLVDHEAASPFTCAAINQLPFDVRAALEFLVQQDGAAPAKRLAERLTTRELLIREFNVDVLALIEECQEHE